MYSLTLDANNRILSATYEQYNPNGILVKNLPDGDITDYRHISNEYVYDPLPKPAEPKPQPSLEERVSDCELMLADIIGGAI